jgi:hypothetical protein
MTDGTGHLSVRFSGRPVASGLPCRKSWNGKAATARNGYSAFESRRARDCHRDERRCNQHSESTGAAAALGALGANGSGCGDVAVGRTALQVVRSVLGADYNARDRAVVTRGGIRGVLEPFDRNDAWSGNWHDCGESVVRAVRADPQRIRVRAGAVALTRSDLTGYRFGAVTVAIVLLVPRASPAWHIALHRFVEVSIGIAVALVFAEVWPEREASLSEKN